MDLLFISAFHTPFENQSYELPSSIQHSNTELENITRAISQNQFNPVDYPNIIIAEPKVLYYRTIADTNGEEGRLLKVLILDVKYWEDEGLLYVIEAINDLARHVQGRYSN